jgi:hypothetical protein
MTRIFGKKGVTPPPPPSPPAGGAGGERSPARMPWKDTPDETAANFAYTHLVKNLPVRLEADGRVHAETLLAASGAICGYACQHAALERVRHGAPTGGDRLMAITCGNGQRYLMGDMLNELFFNGPGDPHAKLWPLLSGTAAGNGLAPAGQPTSAEIFSPIAASLGEPHEGRISVDDRHQPAVPVAPLLRAVWPLAMLCLTGEIMKDSALIRGSGRSFAAPVALWPAVTAWAAVQHFGQALGVLDARTAMLIVMQSASFGSKLPRDRIEG